MRPFLTFQALTQSEIQGSRQASRRRLSYHTIGQIVALCDVAGIVTASIFGQYLYKAFYLGERVNIDVVTGIGLITAFIYISLAHAAELYRLPRILAGKRCFAEISVMWVTSLLVLTALLFLLKIGTDFSRGALITFSVLQLPLLWIARTVAATTIGSMIESASVVGRVAVLIGHRDQIERFDKHDLLHNFGYAEAHRVFLNEAGTDKLASCRAAIDEAIVVARRIRAEEFVLAIGWHDTDLLAKVSQALQSSPLPVKLLPDHVVRSALTGRRTDTSMSPMITVEVQRAPMSVAERSIKRILDLVLASLAIMMLCPLFVLIAVAVKIDSSGPIIFKQRRNGFNRLEFQIFKFRTMRVLEDGQEIPQAQRHDPRVTRVGRLLRRTSIDELPQLFNVVRGDMSLVGPRPHALAHDNQYSSLIDAYCFRHHVKPGITGWAQVHGLRGETRCVDAMAQRIEFDLWYINNWSFVLDIRILARTFFVVMKHDAF